ncbi:cytochrome P450 1A1-like [Mizuhopecten yessoensis]|uniref:unspecific monooxygenase n=1 Tax=Mizuhopecten yessoensis TaxID=6573 RepID=A0A210QNM5_MIZYE|nr:cytochrome P450 1A1-like [Mizuhopecten yessoensis]XP_021353746.1 cytochrome P450 1A1-like [Mizuhopecten yessoensis]OWF50344.1 Cytochrome P450 1A1 [Mizuhopecten yessoensis]
MSVLEGLTFRTNILDELGIKQNLFGVLFTFTVVLLLTRLLQLYFLAQWKPRKNLPPGPRGYPIIGDLLFFSKHGSLQSFRKLRQQYGDIYSIRMGMWPTVVISGKDAFKAALCMEEFADRPLFFINRLIGGAKGLVFGKYNSRWVLHRKIAGNALKMFTGTRNNPITEMVQEQAENLVNEFLEHNGEPFDPNEGISFSVGSVIYQVVYGRGKLAREDKQLSYLIRNFNDFKTFVRVGNPFDVMPFMAFLTPWKYKGILSILFRMGMLAAKKIKRHKKSYDPDHLRDATDGLLHATYTYSAEDKQKVGLTNKMLMETLHDYIGAGFDTVASTLIWGFMYLAESTEVQSKARAEIDNVLGSRTVTIQDRAKLPYVEALMLEVLRTAATLPMAIPHCTTRDIKFRDYVIPKNTAVFFDVYGTSFDVDLWDNPDDFNPERFLNKDGKLDQAKVDLTVSFGFGKRRCIGESLARLEVFLFLVNVLQRCELYKPEGHLYDKDGYFSFVRSPEPFKLIARPTM